MRPVYLLDRTKNLYQSDGLHFISDSFHFIRVSLVTNAERRMDMRRFQDEVRSVLLKYALVPGFLIAFICILLAAV